MDRTHSIIDADYYNKGLTVRYGCAKSRESAKSARARCCPEVPRVLSVPSAPSQHAREELRQTSNVCQSAYDAIIAARLFALAPDGIPCGQRGPVFEDLLRRTSSRSRCKTMKKQEVAREEELKLLDERTSARSR